MDDAYRHGDPVVIYADGVHDDCPGLQAWLDGDAVIWPSGERFSGTLRRRNIVLDGTVRIHSNVRSLTILLCDIEHKRDTKAFEIEPPVTASVSICHNGFEGWR